MKLNKEDVVILKEGELSIVMCCCICGRCGARVLVPKEIVEMSDDGVDCITEGCDYVMSVFPAGKIKLSDWLNRDNLVMRLEETRDGFYINVFNKQKENNIHE